MKYLTRWLIAFIAPLEASFAGEPPRTIQASFYSFAYAPNLESVQVHHDDRFEQVRLSTANLSPSVTLGLIEDKAILFDPQNPQRIIANIHIPESIRHALIILVPSGSESSLPYRGFALNFDHQDFPNGTYQLVNLSPHPIRGAIGSSYAEVSPGKIKSLTLEGEPGTVQGLKFEFLEKNRWNRLTESRCAVRKDRRWLVCVYQDPASQRIHLRSIPDRSSLTSTAGAPTTAGLQPSY